MPKIVFEDSVQTKEQTHAHVVAWSDGETELTVTTANCDTTVQMTLLPDELCELAGILVQAYGKVADEK